jgi:hypothetical protein
MPIDPSIILRAGQGVPPIQQPDPYDRYAKILGIQSAQGAQQLQAMQLDAARRGVADEDATRAAFTEAAGDQSKTLQALYGRGLYKPAQAIEKARDESLKTKAGIAKDTAAAAKSENEVAIENMKRGASILSLATPENWSGIRMLMISDFPKTASQLPEQFDPEFVKAKIAQGQTITERLKAKHDAATLAETARGHTLTAQTATRGQDLSAATAREGHDVTRRGQNMVDARGRDTADRGDWQYDEARGLQVNKRTGEARPVTQGGAPIGVKQSEAQKKELMGLDQQEQTVSGALAAVEKTPSAFGFRRGAATMAGPVSESIAGRMDSTPEREARSYVFNVVSKVINERAGAAQSAQELARLRSFLPAEVDNADQIKDKLIGFKTYLSDMRKGTMGAQPKAPAGATAGWSIKPVP